ncbi:DUF3617 domain-containing protein [Deefgea rivuli]|uniref:DUF3617 domain-containing protein n=1 Tax=Deefgea rivuli TaxID=400948 RepID=UPI000481D72D|nr:DUF3617 family protein [Deefgea rivuli]
MFRLALQSSIVACIFSSAYCNAALNPQLGLWESTSEIPAEQKAMFQQMKPEALQQMQKSGMKIDPKAGTMSMTFCINKEQLNQWHQMGQKPQQHCDKPQISDNGNIVTMDMVCSKPHPSKMHSTIQFNDARDAYQYQHLIKTENHSMTLRGSAKRIGDCK